MKPAYRWIGGEGKGFMRRVREMKRAEAEERNVRTPPERRRAARRGAG